MSVAFHRGKQLGNEDLNVFLENGSGRPADANEITYALYDFTTGAEVLVGPPRRQPVHPQVGAYYASVVIPISANLGPYRVRWTFREEAGGPINQVVQEFEVIDHVTGPVYSSCEQDMLHRMRLRLRDSDPDRHYRFRPPTHESAINQFNKVFGYIWEDVELSDFLSAGLDMVAAAPPYTGFSSCEQLMQTYPQWRTLVLNGAMMQALFAVQLNWISEEFSYNIGGVSLDLEKSSKYQSAYETLKGSFDEQLERAKLTVKFIRGLQQPKYGMGIRSAFGPHTSAGSLTPRKFIGF